MKAYRSDHDNDAPKFSTNNNCPSGQVVVRNEEGPTGSTLSVDGAVINPGQSVCVNDGASVEKCSPPKYEP